jgi:biotin carboxylase
VTGEARPDTPYDTEELGELIEYGLGALDAVGLRQWAAHTEIMMTPDGPRLLEVNARLAGAGENLSPRRRGAPLWRPAGPRRGGWP